jgi:multidrug efflux pump subunit AcrA (membrane-fusion protein)
MNWKINLVSKEKETDNEEISEEEISEGEMKNEEESGKTKPKKKHRGRRLLLILVAAAAAAALGAGAVRARKSAPAAEVDLSLARTVTLTKGNLDESISVSGVVASASVTTVTTTLTGAKVTAVNVKVGDTVKKGDTIAILDSSEIDQEIAARRKALAQANAELQDTARKDQTSVQRAQESRNQTAAQQDLNVQAAKNALAQAQANLDAAKHALSDAQDRLPSLQQAVTDAQSAYDAAAADRQAQEPLYQQALDERDTAQKNLEEAKAAGESDSAALSALESALQTAQDNLDPLAASWNQASALEQDKLSALNAAKEALAGAETQISSLPAEISSRQAAVTSAQNSYDTAVLEKNSSLKQADYSIQDSQAQASASAARARQGSDDADLKELLKKKEGCVLKAESDGQITALNVTVGSLPKDEVAKIQSVDHLVLQITIPEADINKVSEGLPVTITADSIEGSTQGTLTSISPTAEAAGDSTTAAGYAAQVTIEDPKGLHIGSKASGNILLSSEKNVYTVPLDAVGTDEEGNSYIRVMQADGTARRVTVTTGRANDYCMVIEGKELKEGMEVLADVSYEETFAQAGENNDSGLLY